MRFLTLVSLPLDSDEAADAVSCVSELEPRENNEESLWVDRFLSESMAADRHGEVCVAAGKEKV